MRTTRITITRISYPHEEANLNRELQYLGGTLGLFNIRDKDKSKFRIFIALLRSVREGLTSDELAQRLGLTRATVIHHCNSLTGAGIVDAASGRYFLRVSSLEELVQKIRTDVDKTLTELEGVARRCDEELGL